MSTLYENGEVFALWASTVVEGDDSTRPSVAAPTVPHVSTRAWRAPNLARAFICCFQVGHCRRETLIRLDDFGAVTQVAVAVNLPGGSDDALDRGGDEGTLRCRKRSGMRFECEGDGLGAHRRQPDLRQISF